MLTRATLLACTFVACIFSAPFEAWAQKVYMRARGEGAVLESREREAGRLTWASSEESANRQFRPARTIPVRTPTQPSYPGSAFWLSAGVGSGIGASDDPAIAGSLNMTYQRRRHLFSARSVIIGDPVFGSFLIYDVGLLYGRAFNVGMLPVSIAAGIGYIAGDLSEACFGFGPSSCSRSNEKPFDAGVGLPLEVRIQAWKTRYVGLSLIGFASFNRERTFRGVLLRAQLGDLE